MSSNRSYTGKGERAILIVDRPHNNGLWQAAHIVRVEPRWNEYKHWLLAVGFSSISDLYFIHFELLKYWFLYASKFSDNTLRGILHALRK